MPLAPQTSHAVRLVNHRRASAHLRVKETGRDNVDARKLAPLSRERLAEMRDKRLGAVVHGLVRGHVDDVRAHARCDDQVAAALTLEDLADVLGAEDDAVDYFLVLLTYRWIEKRDTVDRDLFVIFV